jgi:TusA-related sulfurtransferase
LSWAQAKCLLDGLKPGDIVRVLTDDPRAVRDLPRAAEAEGYAIVEIVPCPQLTRIVIER